MILYLFRPEQASRTCDVKPDVMILITYQDHHIRFDVPHVFRKCVFHSHTLLLASSCTHTHTYAQFSDGQSIIQRWGVIITVGLKQGERGRL